MRHHPGSWRFKVEASLGLSHHHGSWHLALVLLPDSPCLLALGLPVSVSAFLARYPSEPFNARLCEEQALSRFVCTGNATAGAGSSAMSTTSTSGLVAGVKLGSATNKASACSAVANASGECGGAACGLNADFMRADCDVLRSLTRLGHAVARLERPLSLSLSLSLSLCVSLHSLTHSLSPSLSACVHVYGYARKKGAVSLSACACRALPMGATP